jgi:hypothetical protein
MATEPTLEELEATIARMEARWRSSPLFDAYEALCLRFEADLVDRRDLALAKSAALMMIKFAEGER